MDSIKIEGLGEVVNALRQMSRRDANRVVRRGLRRGGAIIRAYEREEAPQLSGKLRKAVRVKGVRPKDGNLAVTAGPSPSKFKDGHFYPAILVHGFQVRGSSGRKVPPNDFVSRTFDRAAQAAAEVAATVIETELTSNF